MRAKNNNVKQGSLAVAKESSGGAGLAPHEHSFVQVGLGKLKRPSGSLKKDVKGLVEECLRGLDLILFPPKLMVLWATPSFKPYKPLLDEIHQKLVEYKLEKTPLLIGASVAACLFDNDAFEEGALLICLASKFIEVKPTVGIDAQSAPQESVAKMLQDLGIQRESSMNPWGNKWLMAFLPGHAEDLNPLQYRASEIVAAFQEQTQAQLPMFGGVASGGIKPGVGSQFLGNEVFVRSTVAALLECDVTSGIALNHGLIRTGKFKHVTDLSKDGRVIRNFSEGSPAKVMEDLPEGTVFGLPLGSGRASLRSTIVPKLVGNEIHLLSPVPKDATLEVMRADSRIMHNAVLGHENRTIKAFSVSRKRVVCVMRIGCVSRLRLRDKIGFDPHKAMVSFAKRLPASIHAGCFMDGEIGVDLFRMPRMNNWSVAEAMFADQISDESLQYRTFAVLAKRGSEPIIIGSLNETMRNALKCVEEIGYPGGMISLVLADGEKKWIVAKVASDGRWQDKVLPFTRRELEGNDVLALLEKDGPIFIRDARTDSRCDKITAKKAGVISFYAYPLFNERGKLIGTLQIDLGDMSHFKFGKLPAKKSSALNAIGAVIADNVNRAIQTEELKISRNLDNFLLESYRCRSVKEALQHFVKGVGTKLNMAVHVRLANKEGTILALEAGNGSYFDVAYLERREINVDDPTSTASTFRNRSPKFVNDTTSDPPLNDLKRSVHSEALQWELAKIAAYAHYPIKNPYQESNEPPLGVICFNSDQPWCFTESTLHSLDQVGHNLWMLIQHLKQKEADRETLTFLREMQLPTQKNLNTYAALRQQVNSLKVAANAEAVSIFLWDEMQERYILRAEAGWWRKNPDNNENMHEWLGAAFYHRGEGMTGILAESFKPEYIDDLSDYKQKYNIETGKWTKQMFGQELDSRDTFEVIALPLRFQDDDSSSTFRSEDIKDLPGIASRLVRHGDPVSLLLWQTLSEFEKSLLVNYKSSAENSKEVQNVIIQALNKLIEEPSVYDRERFQGIALRPETSDLLNQSPIGSVAGRLNYLLLGDFYRMELSHPSLGIVTMHRRRKRSIQNAQSGFTTTDRATLKDAARTSAVSVAALQKTDETNWESRDRERFEKVRAVLADPRNSSVEGLMRKFCVALVDRDIYGFSRCAVYLRRPEAGRLLDPRLPSSEALNPRVLPPLDSNQRWIIQAAAVRSDKVHSQSVESGQLNKLPLGAEESVPTSDLERCLNDVFMTNLPKIIRRPTSIGQDASDPKMVSKDNLIQALFFPIRDRFGTVGVVEMRWDGRKRERTMDPSILPHHNESRLRGLTLQLERGVIEAKKLQLATNALKVIDACMTSANEYQTFHDVKNAIDAFMKTIPPLEKAIRVGKSASEATKTARRRLAEAKAASESMRAVFNGMKEVLIALANTQPGRIDLVTFVEMYVATCLQFNPVRYVSKNHLNEPSIYASADPDHLRICMRLLILNACRSIGNASGAEVKVGVETDPDSAFCAITIQDNGPGMSADQFNRFKDGKEKSNEHVKSNETSTSFGILLAKLLLDANGGDLHPVETPERGLIVRIILRKDIPL